MVVPSRFESLPDIVLEAVAGQSPLISTHVGGVPETVSRIIAIFIEHANNPPRSSLPRCRGMPLASRSRISGTKLRACPMPCRARFAIDLMVRAILSGYRVAAQESWRTLMFPFCG